jgi:chemotaxis protein MotB
MPVSKKLDAEAEPTVVVRRVQLAVHSSGHHGGAWKVAYADFATAMMAFFMLLWIVGATTEKQRKGIADYFSPTLVKVSSKSSGSDGLLQGRSIRDDAGGAPAAASGGRGMIPKILPREIGTGQDRAKVAPDAPALDARTRDDRAMFARVKAAVDSKLAAEPDMADLREQVRYTQTREGLRIEIIDRAGFSMFQLGTDHLLPRAARLMTSVAAGVIAVPNPVAVRGHTDSVKYGSGDMNNWKLSAYRAERTRGVFEAAGVPERRFARIEGVADREPFVAEDPTNARNRRITVTLFYGNR